MCFVVRLIQYKVVKRILNIGGKIYLSKHKKKTIKSYVEVRSCSPFKIAALILFIILLSLTALGVINSLIFAPAIPYLIHLSK